MKNEDSLVRRFFRYRKHLIMPTFIIVIIIGGILSWLTIDYFCLNLIPKIWDWGFEPIIWWKAISAFVADLYLGGIVFILLLMFLFTPTAVFFQIYVEDIEKYHYQKYLKTIHNPYPELYIFLSHKSEDKEQVEELKEKLNNYGIKCFVAHKSIEPTKEWEDEIIKALRSMDMLIALITDNFKNSDWTSQEIGFALGKNVPIVSVNLGSPPYGFIGREQALDSTWDSLSKDIIDTLFKNFMHIDKVVDIFIIQMSRCQTFHEGNVLSNYLPHLKQLTPEQVNQMIEIYNSNNQLNGSFGFNGYEDKKGLIFYLNKIEERNTN